MNAPRTFDEGRERGWGTWLLLGACVLAGGTMLVIILASLLVPRAIDRAIDTYTATTPLNFPEPRAEPDERESVELRIEAFADALENGRADTPLVLTEREINLLAAEAVHENALAGLQVDLEPGRIRAQVSLPLEGTLPLGPWSRELTGRFLNGAATVRAAVRDGELDLHLAAFEVNGRAVPEFVLRRLRDEMTRRVVLDDPELNDALRRILSIDIYDDRVVIDPAR